MDSFKVFSENYNEYLKKVNDPNIKWEVQQTRDKKKRGDYDEFVLVTKDGSMQYHTNFDNIDSIKKLAKKNKLKVNYGKFK